MAAAAIFLKFFLRRGIPPRCMVGREYHPTRCCGASPQVVIAGKGRRHFGVAIVPMVDIFLVVVLISQ